MGANRKTGLSFILAVGAYFRWFRPVHAGGTYLSRDREFVHVCVRRAGRFGNGGADASWSHARTVER